MGTNGQRINVDGVELYYEHHGRPREEGVPVLVLVHGYLSSCFSFRLLIPYLDKYTIYALDLPGFGESEKSKTFTYSMHNYGRLIIDFIQAIGLPKAVVIGHSMGGQICLNAARQSPDLIDKVIGLSASGYMGRVKRQLVWATYLPFIRYILRVYFLRKKAKETFSSVVYDSSMVNDDMMNGYLKPLQSPDFYQSFVRFVRHREGDLHSDQLQEIKQPVLLLWGKEDRIVPLNVGERLSRDLPNATFKVYEKTGHLLPEERPEDVSQMIEQFVERD